MFGISGAYYFVNWVAGNSVSIGTLISIALITYIVVSLLTKIQIFRSGQEIAQTDSIFDSNVKMPRQKRSNAFWSTPSNSASSESKGLVKIGKAKRDKSEFAPSENNEITFDDIAGYESTKESMQFIVDCLTKREVLDEVGAKLPAGILFYGPPGTGKTLFATAISNMAHVNIFPVNASNFVEKYVGVGAKHVRELYSTARKHAPCIVFIDELDAVGSQRTGEMNDERRQTLNALLVELNGSHNNSGVLTIAATNDIECLDKALLRPGRFDRKIAIPLPDKKDREAIIKLHFSKKKVDESVDFDALAMLTEGMSGSTIATIANEAAIHAVSKGRTIINSEDIDNAVFLILMNGEKKELLDEDDLKIVAYHEAGHALITKLLTDDIIPQVTIIGSTSGAGGVTFRHSSKEKAFTSKRDAEHYLMTLFGGRAAEEYYFKNDYDITNGASSDLKKASGYIREYLTTYGMSSDSILNVSAFSGATQNRGANVDSLLNEAKAFANEMYQKTLTIIESNSDKLEAIATALIKKKSLSDNELNSIIAA